ncbi:hypothetical protein KC315_g469 [Hortaea werneckii]|nr:hypothetical protein KC315_g469 [Hortaea werneckii]KAI7540802.1 hypothetical protein KC331_g8957 [Hortaea werneckii]KAI7718343.1 hypothetical protein KC353_g3861 [Hortaea werneckii]
MASFPHFEDGDVHIIITGSRQYHLHSAVLRSNSPVLARLLNEENAARLSNKAIRRGATVRFRIVMTDNTTRDGGLPYALKAVPLNEEGKPTEHQIVGLDLENGRVVPAEVLAYESVFSALYNAPIDLGDFETDGMVHVLTRVWSVVDAAEQLQCTHVVTHAIEATLLATGQLLQQSIATSPAPWLILAYKIHSRNLFRESIIHAAGKYNTEEIQKEIVNMPKDVADLLHKKGRTLREAVKMAEKRILSYYPTHLQRERTVGRADKDSIGRASYSNDVMSWIGLVVLRHFFTQLLADDATHNALDMGKELVDAVMQGGDTYLDKGIMDQFHAYFPMSQKGASVLENKVSDMKESIKKFMADLHKNESMLDTKTFKVAHFTCVKVFQHEYPFGEARRNVAVDETDDMSE